VIKIFRFPLIDDVKHFHLSMANRVIGERFYPLFRSETERECCKIGRNKMVECGMRALVWQCVEDSGDREVRR